ncbi:MAG: siphovirus Gp157 family protein [Pseudomonadota bacterium]
MRRKQISAALFLPETQEALQAGLLTQEPDSGRLIRKIGKSLEEMALLVHHLGSEIRFGYEMEKRVQEFLTRREELRGALKVRIVELMEEKGVVEADAGIFRVRIKKTRMDVKVVGELPSEYQVGSIPNWKKIRKSLEAGKAVPGAELVPGKPILVIE